MLAIITFDSDIDTSEVNNSEEIQQKLADILIYHVQTYFSTRSLYILEENKEY
ncbi:1838_t:CDS:1 [Gigaspora margarita]|uniref:1838_t:CDS:1 n=1 Tax=Gigaspora margarita TaxID=4874 RepID=A0ABN7WHA3_GIGMA|nr:1838_t:CDS:1 [Gigaspora margarita]